MDRFQAKKVTGSTKYSLLRKPKSQTIYRLVLLACLLISVGCSFDKPSAPSWDVEVSIPLISQVFTMSEIADNQESIILDSTGLLAFEEISELDKYEVGDQLDLKDIDGQFTMEMGVFEIDAPGSNGTTVELQEIFSNATTLDGQNAIIPTFSFITDTKPLNSYDDFLYAQIESGALTIRVVNGLSIPLGSPIDLEVWDSTVDTLIFVINSTNQIPAGQTKSFEKSLAGIKLPNTLSMRMSGSSPGSSGSPVLIKANSRFEMLGEISPLEVVEAVARIPAQTVKRTDAATIEDSIVVYEADVESGAINISLSGNMPLDSWIVYTLPDFYRPNGVALLDSFFVNRNQNASTTINLAGFILRPQNGNFSQQEVVFDWRIRTEATGDNFAFVRSTDLMNANFSLSALRFVNLTGKIGQQNIDVSQNDIELDIPADMDSIFFETAELEMIINNSINFPGRLQFSLQGENKNGGTSFLDINEIIQPAEQAGVVKTTVIRLNQKNSNIKNFISILPNLVKVNGQVALGDLKHVGTISKNDFVNGTVKLAAPFSLKLPAQDIEGKASEMEIEDDVKEDIINNLSEGSFFSEIKSNIPLGASVQVLFSTNEQTIFSNPNLKIGPLRANPGAISPDGYVQSPATNEFNFKLTKEQMQLFTKDKLFSAVYVSIDGTNGKYVKFRGSDSLQLKSYATIELRVNAND